MTVSARADANRLLAAKAVAQLTSMSRHTVYRLSRAGQFPTAYQIAPRRVAWKEADVIEWLNNRPAVTWSEAA